MSVLAYRARDEAGRLHRGQVESRSAADLRERLRAEGLYLIDAGEPSPRRHVFGGRVPARERILFTYHLQAIVAGGVPLLLGLQDLAASTRHRVLRTAVEEVHASLAGGATLAQALARHPRIFPPSYVCMVEAGETGGRLDEALGRLVQLLEWSEELRAQVRGLLTGPGIAATALLGLVGLLLGFVLPRFRDLLLSLQVELPVTTRALLGLSAFVTAHWPWLLAAGAAGAAGWFVARRVALTRLAIDAVSLRLPIVGPLQRDLIGSQVAHFLGGFVQAGVPIGLALEQVTRIVDNTKASKDIRYVLKKVLEGASLTDAFRSTGLLPPLVLRMVSIGEETGHLPESLAKAREYYDREVPRQVKRLFEFLGPALTLILGAALLFVILSILLPIYRMYSAVQGG